MATTTTLALLSFLAVPFQDRSYYVAKEFLNLPSSCLSFPLCGHHFQLDDFSLSVWLDFSVAFPSPYLFVSKPCSGCFCFAWQGSRFHWHPSSFAFDICTFSNPITFYSQALNNPQRAVSSKALSAVFTSPACELVYLTWYPIWLAVHFFKFIDAKTEPFRQNVFQLSGPIVPSDTEAMLLGPKWDSAFSNASNPTPLACVPCCFLFLECATSRSFCLHFRNHLSLLSCSLPLTLPPLDPFSFMGKMSSLIHLSLVPIFKAFPWVPYVVRPKDMLSDRSGPKMSYHVSHSNLLRAHPTPVTLHPPTLWGQFVICPLHLEWSFTISAFRAHFKQHFLSCFFFRTN